MAKTVRNIVRNIKVQQAAGRRTCHVDKSHVIEPGQRHLAVYELTGRQNVCGECAGPVMTRALEHIADIRRQLGT